MYNKVHKLNPNILVLTPYVPPITKVSLYYFHSVPYYRGYYTLYVRIKGN